MQHANINFYREKNPILNDAYDRLISRIPILKKERGNQLFTVTGCEPGVGTTTIAISMAVSMANAGWKTLLVDADVRKLLNKKRLSEESLLGLSDYLSGHEKLEDVISTTNIENMHYVASGTPSENPVALLNSQYLDVFADYTKQHYDFVFFDSPSLNTTIDAAILAAKTSGAIIIAGYHKTKKSTIEVALRELDQTGANLIGIVLNSVSKKDYRRHIGNYDYFFKSAQNKNSKKK